MTIVVLVLGNLLPITVKIINKSVTYYVPLILKDILSKHMEDKQKVRMILYYINIVIFLLVYILGYTLFQPLSLIFASIYASIHR